MEEGRRQLPTTASFLVSEDCNLACTYCFEIEYREECNKSMTIEVARKGLEYLFENALEGGENSVHAMLFGGEPLMQPKIVEEVLRYGLELEQRYRIKFTSSMVTNATILTDEIKRIISTYAAASQLSVQLSVDGIKEVHDKYRVTKGGKGSFDLIERNIDGWKELFKYNMDALSIHGCCNRETLPYLYENYIFFREKWNVPRLWFLPIHNEEWEEGDVKIYEEQLTKIMDYILEKARKNGNLDELINYAPLDRALSCDVRPYAPCGAGKNFITITANGEIYPCHSFYYNDPEKTTKIGDIWNGIDEPTREIFIKYDNSDISCAKECPDCDAYQCYRCIADNWMVNGSIFSQIRGPRCEMSKIERKLHLKLREELKGMGLLDQDRINNLEQTNETNNLDCLCNLRTNDNAFTQDYDEYMSSLPEQDLLQYEKVDYNNCDLVQDISHLVDNMDKRNSVSSNEETIALALHMILEKVESLEDGQNLIIKRLLK